MKEATQILEKLTHIEKRSASAKAEGFEKLEKARGKLRAAEAAREEAEDLESFLHASRKIEEARAEIDFFKKYTGKLEKPFTMKEYEQYSAILTSEYIEEYNEHARTIQLNFEAFIKSLEALEDATREIQEAEELLSTLTRGKATASASSPLGDLRKAGAEVDGFRLEAFIDCYKGEKRLNSIAYIFGTK